MSIFEEYGAFKTHQLVVKCTYSNLGQVLKGVNPFSPADQNNFFFANSVNPDETAHISSVSTLFAILVCFLTETPI